MNAWAALMVLAGGLFAGAAATFAWSRVPIWRRMPASQFVADFADTLAWTDKVQPALLVTAIGASIVFAATTEGTAAPLALVGAAGFVVTLVASVTVMVPLQRTIIATPPTDADRIDAMRARWFGGNLTRAVVATTAFAAVAAAAAM